MIFLIKIIDYFIGTKMYYFMRLEEIIDIIEEKDYKLGINLLTEFYSEIEKLGYNKEFLSEIDYYISELYFRAGEINSAIEYCEKAYSIFESPYYVYRIGCIYYEKLLEPKKAIPYLEKAYSVDDEFLPALILLSEINLRIDDYDKAEYYLQKSIAIKKDPKALQMLGELFMKQEKYEESIEVLNEATILDGENADVFYLLGCAFLRLKKQEEAINHFSKATFYNEKHIGAYFEIANLYQFASEEIDKAIIAYQKILDIDAENKDASFNLATLLFNSKKNVKIAKKLVFEIMKYDEQDYKVIMLLVDIYIYLYNYVLAMKYLEKLPSDDQNVIYKKALIYFRSGEWKLAEKHFLLLDEQTAEIRKYIQKIALFQAKEVFTILSWEKTDKSMIISGMKKNGPFIIDNLNITILNEYPESDYFYSFKKGEVDANDGFLAISRWISDPVVVLNQSMKDLDMLSGEEDFSFCSNNIDLRKFFFSFYMNFKEMEKEIFEYEPAERVRKIHSLFLEAIKIIRKSPFMINQCLKLEYMNIISNLPKKYYTLNIPREVSQITANSEKKKAENSYNKSIIEFIEKPNYYKNWKVFIIPSESNKTLFSSINYISNKKRKKVYIVFNNQEQLITLNKELTDSIGINCFGIYSESLNYICPAKLVEFLNNNHYPEEIFYILNWYKNSPDGNFSFMDPFAYSIFPNLKRVMRSVSAKGCYDWGKCPHSENCPYVHAMEACSENNIVLIELSSFQNSIDNRNIPSGIILYPEISSFNNMLIRSRRFSLDEVEILLYNLHLRFIKSDNIKSSNDEKHIVKIQKSLLSIKKLFSSLKNHMLYPETSIDFELLHVRFPFLYHSIKDELGNLFADINDARNDNIINGEFVEEILAKLQILIEGNIYSGICLNNIMDSFEFFMIDDYSYQNIISFCDELVFIENKLTEKIVDSIINIFPSREAYKYIIPHTEKNKNEPPTDKVISLFKPEFKYIYKKNGYKYWNEFLKYNILSSISRDMPISLGTLVFLIKKTLRYHQKISSENLDNLIDNIYIHFPEGIGEDFLIDILSKKENIGFSLNIDNLYKFMGICTLISRIEGKRVIVIANKGIVSYFGKLFRRMNFIECCYISSEQSQDEFDNVLKILKSGLPRIILCEYPMNEYEFIKNIFDELVIDYKYSIGYECENYKNFKIDSSDDLEFQIDIENDICILDKESLLPSKSSFIVKNPCIKGIPFNISDLYFISKNGKVCLDFEPKMIDEFEKEIIRMENVKGLSKIKSLLKSYLGKEFIISKKMMNMLAKRYPFWKNGEELLNFLEYNQNIEVRSYYTDFAKFYLKNNEAFYIFRYDKDKENYMKKPYFTNIMLEFNINSELNKGLISGLSRKLDLLDFLGKQVELNVSGKYLFKLSDMITATGLDEKDLIKDLEFLASISVCSFKIESDEIMISLISSISSAIRNLIRHREIVFNIIEQLKKYTKENTVNAFSLYKNHFSNDFSELEFEYALFELHFENFISISFKKPFLSSGYEIFVKECTIDENSIKPFFNDRKRLKKFIFDCIERNENARLSKI